MELEEVCPFLFIVSSSNQPTSYTEISLDDYEILLKDPEENKELRLDIDKIIDSFPHKNYIPYLYIAKSPYLQRFSYQSILQTLVCSKSLTPIFNKSGLCFIFTKKSKLAKLSEFVKENASDMCGQVIKIAADVKQGRIGEDLIISLTNGIEKMFKNNSENYLKTIVDGKKKKKGPSICIISPQPCQKVLREISNSGN